VQPAAVTDGDENPAQPIRVVVADDNTLFREGIAEICEIETDLHVVGQAENGNDAVTLVRRENPDVVLLDVEMPGPDPGEVLGKVLSSPSAPRVAVLSMHDDARMVSRLMSTGAQAYISKSSTREELLAAIRAVSKRRDHVVLSVPKITMTQLGQPSAGPLSPRELEVLDLVAQGLSNAQIGARLYISEGTVKRHLTNIYLKLDVRSRTNAINKAVALRLL
jgi:DNA-binding NarL/FixJ family response regulator